MMENDMSNHPVCHICNVRLQCKNLKAYTRHYQIHRHERNVHFPCCVPGCMKTCFTYKGLVSHVSRHHGTGIAHGNDGISARYQSAGVSVKCMMQFCQQQCSDIQEFLAHLKNHIKEGLTVACPFGNCTKQFNVKSSFSSHISRYHRHYTVHSLTPALLCSNVDIDSHFSNPQSNTEPCTDACEDSSDDDDECADEKGDSVAEYTKAIALFLLKLHSKSLVPETTIQTIVDEMNILQQLTRDSAKKIVKCKLMKAGVSGDVACKVADDILDGIAELGCSLAPSEDSHHFQSQQCGTLRSSYLRKNYYKNTFKFVSPVEINLGIDSSGKTHICHYVPILETLRVLCEDTSVHRHWVPNRESNQGNCLNDIHDGKVFKQNAFFQSNPDALQILLFQDSFEIVNPLGSARCKHKVLGIYYTLGNIDPRCRSQIDTMQLVMVCKEKSIKEFGPEAVLSRLVKDIQQLECEGISVHGGKVVKGTLLAIIGDNLGSHYIGGFTESFCASYYCRYCLRSKSEIADNPPYIEGLYRTKEMYNNSIQVLNEGDADHVQGIKFNSVFNSLSFFHVINPGLPPCLGHDLFEGVVDYDLALYIQHFVVDKNWFTYECLNAQLARIPFSACDSKNMLFVVRKGERVGGHAVQNWWFLRFFPIVMNDYILDTGNPTWGLLMKLKEIVEIIVSPSVDSSQVAYLKVIIDEYLEQRKELFPQKKLRPKHHFLCHYPWLILMFGPLIRVWTLRFESKHAFFKKCIRISQNFKNVTSLMSERHQLMQAYSFHGNFFPDDVKVKHGTAFDPYMYADNIQKAVQHMDLHEHNCKVSDETSVFGTCYKKGMYVLVKDTTGTCGWAFSMLLLVLVSDRKVYFLVRPCQSTFLCKLGLYKIFDEGQCGDSDVICVPYCDLADYCPLASYKVGGCRMITLKNVPCAQFNK